MCAAPYVAQVASSEASHNLKACNISNILPPLPSLQFCSLHEEENGSYFLTRQLQSPLCWSADSRRTAIAWPAEQDRYQLLFGGWGRGTPGMLFKDEFHVVDVLTGGEIWPIRVVSLS